MNWNKEDLRESMLSLETAALQSARDIYLDYVATARLDRSESIENDEQAQAEVAVHQLVVARLFGRHNCRRLGLRRFDRGERGRYGGDERERTHRRQRER